MVPYLEILGSIEPFLTMHLVLVLRVRVKAFKRSHVRKKRFGAFPDMLPF